MKIWKKLKAENIFLDISLPDKASVLRFVADACERNKVVTRGDALREGLRQREKTLSTGIGKGIAFPHATSPDAKDATVLLIRPAEPLDFESLDGLPVDIVIAIVIPEGETSLHLRILAGASRLCKNAAFLTLVRQADTPERLREDIRNLEERMAFH